MFGKMKGEGDVMKNKKKYLGILLVTVIIFAIIIGIGYALKGDSSAADPTGGSYTAISDSVSLPDAAATASKGYFGANYTWVMICAFMVFFFQCGFAMVETGFCRAKNAAHTMTMNFMVFLVGAIGYFIAGFALQMGGSGGAAGLGSGGAALNALISIPGF